MLYPQYMMQKNMIAHVLRVSKSAISVFKFRSLLCALNSPFTFWKAENQVIFSKGQPVTQFSPLTLNTFDFRLVLSQCMCCFTP